MLQQKNYKQAISRILFYVAIYLNKTVTRLFVRLLPVCLPYRYEIGRATQKANPIAPFTGGGLHTLIVTDKSGELLPRLFTLTCSYTPLGGIFSVALSLGLPPAVVNSPPALRSPDFPLPPVSVTTVGSGHMACLYLHYYSS